MSNSNSRKPMKLVLLLTTIALAGLAVGVTMISGGGSDSEQIVQSESSSTPVTESTDVDTNTTVTEASADLYLNVTSPADQSVSDSLVVDVTGKTLSTAIVSVNGKMASVDATGAFAATVSLENGPNFIEVVASTVGGAEISEILSVIYIP
jgi:hypothetical protein